MSLQIKNSAAFPDTHPIPFIVQNNSEKKRIKKTAILSDPTLQKLTTSLLPKQNDPVIFSVAFKKRSKSMASNL